MTGIVLLMARRLTVLLVAAMMLIAPAAASATATAMAQATSVAHGAEPGGCAGCAEGDMDAGACGAICFSAGQLALPAAPVMPARDLHPHPLQVLHGAWPGRSPPPEPAPPKSIAAG